MKGSQNSGRVGALAASSFAKKGGNAFGRKKTEEDEDYNYADEVQVRADVHMNSEDDMMEAK